MAISTNQQRPKWDKHCLLVIQFPISLPTEIRRSARFAEVKRALRQGLDRFAPSRALDFFLHPAGLPMPVASHSIMAVGHGAQSFAPTVYPA